MLDRRVSGCGFHQDRRETHYKQHLYMVGMKWKTFEKGKTKNKHKRQPIIYIHMHIGQWGTYKSGLGMWSCGFKPIIVPD